MEKKHLIVGIVLTALIVGPLSFALGKHVAPKNNAAAAFGQRGQMGQGAQQGMRTTGARTGMMGGGVSGEVIAKDDKSITVKLIDGGSKIVFLSGSTQVSKQASAVLSDVLVGSSVQVMGATNADGSVTAQSVQLRSASAPAAQTPR